MTLFPREFLWGAGPSNGHLFTHQPGRTAIGETAVIARKARRTWGSWANPGLMRQLIPSPRRP